MIKTIIFDIGGVVANTDFKSLYKNFADKVGISYNFVNHYHDENYLSMILGHTSFEKFLQDMLNAGADKNLDLKAIWMEEGIKNREVNEELLEIIKNLRKDYTVGALTNVTHTRLIFDKEMDLYSNFDYSVLSCEEHKKKPDLAFYKAGLRKAGVKADEVIFVDDRKDCVTAAEEAGMKGILYKYPDNVRLLKGLKKFKVYVKWPERL